MVRNKSERINDLEDLTKKYPLLEKIVATDTVFWTNPKYTPNTCGKFDSIGRSDIKKAEERLARFAPYIAKTFPETVDTKGIIESPLVRIPKMQSALMNRYGHTLRGTLYLKCDNLLPISGTIKARGGIYEVLKVAEEIALRCKMLSYEDDYSKVNEDDFKKLFSKYTIVVGSTGNLALSIGTIGVALGFKVIAHMSSDAKQWKKDLLRSKGVKVIEHDFDYTEAVQSGRQDAAQDSGKIFIDDESSHDLFLGYAVAAVRLKKQLDRLKVGVDEDHPLFVYLPCGVGGAPGGVAFGLKSVFKKNVHCFFAEPTHSPAMLIGLLTGLYDQISVQELGIDNITEADGLAVGRSSKFVGNFLKRDISGVYTVQDRELYSLLRAVAQTENIRLEPSAAAGFMGPVKLLTEPAGLRYLESHKLTDKMMGAIHMVWATGGSMVPDEIMKQYYEKGNTDVYQLTKGETHV